MTPRELLIAARALIADPKDWTQGDFTNHVDGRLCYCAHGALIYAEGGGATMETVEHALSDEMEGHIGVFNDTHEHHEVLAAFDRAIAKAAA